VCYVDPLSALPGPLYRGGLLPAAPPIPRALPSHLGPRLPQQGGEELPVARPGLRHPAPRPGGPGGRHEARATEVCLQGVRHGGTTTTSPPSRHHQHHNTTVTTTTIITTSTTPPSLRRSPLLNDVPVVRLTDGFLLVVLPQAFNWLLCNVIQTTSLHDILWHFVSSLTLEPEEEEEEEEENKANKENVEQVRRRSIHNTPPSGGGRGGGGGLHTALLLVEEESTLLLVPPGGVCVRTWPPPPPDYWAYTLVQWFSNYF